MKPVKGPRLGSGPQHQKLMLGSLASALIQHERIRTTETKAKRLVPVADRLVTLGKSGSVHARRRALSIIEDRAVVHKLFAEIAPRYAERSGGYTRVVRLGPRQGDAAPMAIIEFVEDTGVGKASAAVEAETKARRLGRRRAGRKAGEKPAAAAPGAEAVAEEPAESAAAEA
ncbi:MAG: 50S ribosomal protein L17, partial [Actinomycetota bacterium]